MAMKEAFGKLEAAWSQAKEQVLGDDFWIPLDSKEAVVVPPQCLKGHVVILPANSESTMAKPSSTGAFYLLRGEYKMRKDTVYHICYKAAKSSSVLSLRRMTSADTAEELFNCAKQRQLLFNNIETDDLKVLKYLLEKVDHHPQWEDVHLAAKLGGVEYFAVDDALLPKLLKTVSRPEQRLPLHIAIESDRCELVQLLLGRGAAVDTSDAAGCNAFHYAARASPKMIQLVASAAKERSTALASALNNDGQTPMSAAASAGKPLCMAALAQLGAAIVAGGRAPLLEAMKQAGARCNDVIKGLLEADAECILARDENGNGALHVATSKVPLNALLALAADRLDVNARNGVGQTALHKRSYSGDLGAVLTLIAYGADVNARDEQGFAALHTAVTWGFCDIAKALICCGADVNQLDNNAHSPRHLVAKSSDSKARATLAHCLALAGARRCAADTSGCSEHCSFVAGASADNDSAIFAELQTSAVASDCLDAFAHSMSVERIRSSHLAGDIGSVVNLLSLDGGGIRGLIITQVLLEVEALLADSVWQYFDWVSGTSTGSIVGACLSVGKTTRDCQRIYLRFKDVVFAGWVRPYNTAILEKFIQLEVGTDTKMSDVEWPRLAITTVLADKHPVRLRLQRSYQLPYLDAEENASLGYTQPSEQPLWRAIRCSSAAPTYFSAVDGKFVDGGLMANNPTLELLAEVQRWKTAVAYKGGDASTAEQQLQVGVVLNVGTGSVPDAPIESLDFDSSLASLALAIKNLGNLFVDQVCASEGAPVERARNACHQLRAPFYRFSPSLSKNFVLDTKEDAEIVSLLWETKEYLYVRRADVRQLADLLTLIGPSKQRRRTN